MMLGETLPDPSNSWINFCGKTKNWNYWHNGSSNRPSFSNECTFLVKVNFSRLITVIRAV